MAEILDIKGSTKSDTIFIKRRELVEKELLDTTEKTTEKENTTQVLEKLNKNKGSLKLSHQNQKILDAKKYPIKPDITVRPKNEKYKQRSSTHFNNPVNISPTKKPKDTLIPGKEPIDAFIDNLIEGEESII